MSNATSNAAVRTKSAFLTLATFPAFLLVSFIPWLVVAHALVISHRLYESGWSYWGAAVKVGAIAIAAFTVFSTLWFIVVWLVVLWRCIRGIGRETNDPQVVDVQLLNKP